MSLRSGSVLWVETPHSNEKHEKNKQRNERFKRKLTFHGLVSRGDDRLRVSEAERKAYFEEILNMFSAYCANNAESPLARLPYSKLGRHYTKKGESPSTNDILALLRKLREALVSLPVDDFTKTVYAFSARVGAMVGHRESYYVSLKFLLENTHLEPLERREFASLLVLHYSHCVHLNGAALRVFFAELDETRDWRIHKILMSWIHGDYHAWITAYNAETDHATFSIMSLGLELVLQHMVLCIGASYFVMTAEELGRRLPTDFNVQTFCERYNWEFGKEIVIRQRGRRRMDN